MNGAHICYHGSMSDNKSYSVYILLCDDNILYTGIARDPKARLKQHLSKKPPGAKFTRRFNKLELVYQVEVDSRSEAQSLEYQIKKMARKDKLVLIEGSKVNFKTKPSPVN